MLKKAYLIRKKRGSYIGFLINLQLGYSSMGTTSMLHLVTAGRVDAVISCRLVHSCAWWLARPLLGQIARASTCGISLWLLGLLTRWCLGPKNEHPKREKTKWKKYLFPFIIWLGCHRGSLLLLPAHPESKDIFPQFQGEQKDCIGWWASGKILERH